jgi:hypothetical protein
MNSAIALLIMDRSAATAMRPDEVIFRDGFGDRVLVRDIKGRPLHETLVLSSTGLNIARSSPCDSWSGCPAACLA